MERYSIITDKNPREIVLLKAFPCAWGKCSFCDYIDDNSRDESFINQVNKEVLEKVTGYNGVLEVIDSASCFELPKETLTLIREVIVNKKITRLFLESHWMYRYRLNEMRRFMGVPITYKIGIETFDNDFRQKVLNKHADFKSPEEVARYFDSPCLLVGIKGQTKEMIDMDMEILKKYFKLGTINIYMNNSTNIKRDENLIHWFRNKYQYLAEDSFVEILFKNTDFGVG